MKPTLLMDPVLLFHGNCPDGFGAAYAFWRKYGDEMEYIPYTHYEPMPNIENRTVFMADIAFSRQDMLKAKELASEITVIDHHLSAMKELEDLEYCHFDLKHSGAMLAWNFNFPDEKPPLLLRYIEDRDLWNWNLPFAEEVLAAVDSYQMNFEKWNELEARINDPSQVAEILKEGKAILRYNTVLMKRLARNVHSLKIRGYEVPAINTPFFRSELVGDLALTADFAAGYHYNGKHYVFSLRSRGDGIDVSEIAATFPGGGGHAKSAGFSVESLEELSKE